MDLDDIHPLSFLAGMIGLVIGIVIMKRMSGAEYHLGIVWKALIPVVSALGGFFVFQKIATN